MSLAARLQLMKRIAEAGGIAFNPPPKATTVVERLARHEMTLTPEIGALFEVCDGADLGGCVSLVSLENYISTKKCLEELACEIEEEEWGRPYIPFAHFNADLILCYAPEDFGVYTLDVECSYIVKVAPSLELFISALESALMEGGVEIGEYGIPNLPSWSKEDKRYGIKEVWNTGG